jgi:hypothetical protein
MFIAHDVKKNTQIKNYSYTYPLFCVMNFMLAACRPNVASLTRHMKGSTNTCAKAFVLKFIFNAILLLCTCMGQLMVM